MDNALRFPLTPAQQAIFNSTASFRVVAAGRRFGKTWLAAVLCIVEGLRTVNTAGVELDTDSEVMYLAPTFEQAKGIFWPRLKLLLQPLRDMGYSVDFHENTGLCTLPNGVRIRLRGMDNPDRARGFKLRFAVLDEYADMPAEAWETIIEPALMDTAGGALFIGTPKGKNHFYQLFEHALSHGVNGLIPPDHPEYDPDWEAFHFTSSDNPAMDAASVARLERMKGRGSREIREQELAAKFITLGGGQLDADRLVYSPREPDDGYFVVAVDIAGLAPPQGRTRGAKERRDNTAIAVVKITRAGWWVKEIVYGQWDARETAVRILLAVKGCHASKLGIEKGIAKNAVQPYLDDVMRQYGVFRAVEPLSHGNQLKETRIAYALEGRLQKGRIILNCEPGLPYGERPDWIQRLIGEMGDFPDPLAKDDLIDALSYVDQLGGTVFNTLPAGIDNWQPLDDITGY